MCFSDICITMTTRGLACLQHVNSYLIEDHHTGDLICSECGLVCGMVMEPNYENQIHSIEVLPGGPPSCNLMTLIEKGSSCNLYRHHNNIASKLDPVYNDIRDMTDRLQLPSCIRDAAIHFAQRVYEANTGKGKSPHAKAAACLYIACKHAGVPRTFKEICVVSNSSLRDITRCWSLITRGHPDMEGPVISATDFIPRFCSHLDLCKETQATATYVARQIIELNLLFGHSPISISVTAIYIASQASDEKRTLDEIAEISGIVVPTIKKCYRAVVPLANKLFPPSTMFDIKSHQLPDHNVKLSSPRGYKSRRITSLLSFNAKIPSKTDVSAHE